MTHAYSVFTRHTRNRLFGCHDANRELALVTGECDGHLYAARFSDNSSPLLSDTEIRIYSYTYKRTQHDLAIWIFQRQNQFSTFALNANESDSK